MNVNWWKVALISVLVIGACVACFFWGRSTIKVQEPEVKYIQGDTIRIYKDSLIAVKVVRPCDTVDVIKKCIKEGKYFELFPERLRDTIIYATLEDTSKVLKDWVTERYYTETVFDIDTIGKATVKAKTQYNRLTWLESDFIPVTKTIITPTTIKKVSPFVGVGITSYPTVVGQAGVFFVEKYGVNVLYQYGWQDKKHIWGGTFMYKF